VDGRVVYHVFTKPELEDLIKRADHILKAEAAKESSGDI